MTSFYYKKVASNTSMKEMRAPTNRPGKGFKTLGKEGGKAPTRSNWLQ